MQVKCDSPRIQQTRWTDIVFHLRTMLTHMLGERLNSQEAAPRKRNIRKKLGWINWNENLPNSQCERVMGVCVIHAGVGMAIAKTSRTRLNWATNQQTPTRVIQEIKIEASY